MATLEKKPTTNEMLGVITQTLLNDMYSTSKLQVELAESIGYDNGYEVGFAAGYRAAQRKMRGAIFDMHEAAGIYSQEMSA